jgi:uncharacterized protein YndB with AHSA1/START domain
MNRPEPLAVTVSTVIAAAPTTVYDLISDITAMGRYSPETVAAHWLDGATEAGIGTRFAGKNAVGRMSWTTKATITAADRGHRFAFRVPTGARSTWTYALAPVDGGTSVTESMSTERAMPALIRFFIRRAGVQDRSDHLRTGMRTTLDRLAQAAVDAGSRSILQ